MNQMGELMKRKTKEELKPSEMQQKHTYIPILSLCWHTNTGNGFLVKNKSKPIAIQPHDIGITYYYMNRCGF